MRTFREHLVEGEVLQYGRDAYSRYDGMTVYTFKDGSNRWRVWDLDATRTPFVEGSVRRGRIASCSRTTSEGVYRCDEIPSRARRSDDCGTLSAVRAGMESLRAHMGRALTELDEWQARSSEAAEYGTDGYRSVATTLRAAAAAETIEELDRLLRPLFRMIVDSGPLSSDFLPSLGAVRDALQRWRQRHGQGR